MIHNEDNNIRREFSRAKTLRRAIVVYDIMRRRAQTHENIVLIQYEESRSHKERTIEHEDTIVITMRKSDTQSNLTTKTK